MKVLQSILRESKEHYRYAKKQIEEKLRNLPAGSIKERIIAGKKYYYLQKRVGAKVIHKYLGKEKPEELARDIKQRKLLEAESKKVQAAFKILRRTEGRKHA